MGAGGVSPASEKEASGEGRIEGDGLGCCTTKPPMPRLAAVDRSKLKILGLQVGCSPALEKKAAGGGRIDGWPR
jgi:hypothetical protein